MEKVFPAILGKSNYVCVSTCLKSFTSSAKTENEGEKLFLLFFVRVTVDLF
jgi:hypothetical protein